MAKHNRTIIRQEKTQMGRFFNTQRLWKQFDLWSFERFTITLTSRRNFFVFNLGNPFRYRYRSGYRESLLFFQNKELRQSLYPYCVLDVGCPLLDVKCLKKSVLIRVICGLKFDVWCWMLGVGLFTFYRSMQICVICGYIKTYLKQKSPLHCCKGLLKKGGDILSHIKMQYHLRNRA